MVCLNLYNDFREDWVFKDLKWNKLFSKNIIFYSDIGEYIMWGFVEFL